MSPVSLGLDGLLAMLLVAALAIGVRLNAKLKSLKESQATFVKAVADLDLAAGRAEAGLSALRAATQEAHDALLTRIETARTLSAKLDRTSEEARTATARLEVAVHRAERAATVAPPEPAPERPAAPALRLVDPAGPEPAAVLRLIETARSEAQGRTADLGALRPAVPPPAAAASATPPAAPVVAPEAAPRAAEDRLSRFVARRREGRSA